MADDAPKVVDERFWLARAAKIVEEASDRLDKGSDRIATAMAWFWGAYSTALTAGLALSPLKLSVAMALLAASPALALFVAYGLATWAALPVPIAFHVLEPENIKRAHEHAVERKRRRLGRSIGFAALAAILVVVASSAFAGMERRYRGEVAIGMSNSEILVGGSAPIDGVIIVRVTSHGVPDVTAVAAAKKNEVFQLAVPVAKASAYDVEVSWQDGARTTVIRQSVKAQ
jgi:hypothetical protein